MAETVGCLVVTVVTGDEFTTFLWLCVSIWICVWYCRHLCVYVLYSSVDFFNHLKLCLSTNWLNHFFFYQQRKKGKQTEGSFIIWHCSCFLVHKYKMCVRHFRKQTCCPRRNNAKLSWLAILVEILTGNQDNLADASLLASSFPSTFQWDITQAI